MKITDVTLTPLKTRKNLLRIQTEAGIEGWAEAPGPNRIIPEREAVFSAYLERVIKPTLVGENPLEIDRHWNTLALGRGDVFHRMPGWVVGIIDVALWDLMGKETGLPVFRLLGGAARTTIPLYWSTGSGWQIEPPEMLDRVTAGWDLGFRAFKIRMDWHGWRQDINPDKDFEMFRLVREFLAPEILPRVRCQQRVLRLDGHPARAPLRGARHQSLRRADPQPRPDRGSSRSPTPSMSPSQPASRTPIRWWFHQLVSARRPRHPATRHSQLPAASRRSKRIYDMAATLNKPVMPHSPHAGINSMASLHVYSTVENTTRPHEFSAEFSGPLDDVAELYGERVLPVNGITQLTEKPGFGIELNEAAVSRG